MTFYTQNIYIMLLILKRTFKNIIVNMTFDTCNFRLYLHINLHTSHQFIRWEQNRTD